MNSVIIEAALSTYLSDTIGNVQTITGGSVDDRTAPSVRIICQSCSVPDGFEMSVQERLSQYTIAVVYSADEDESKANALTLFKAIAQKMNQSRNEVVIAEGYEVLFHSSFLMDQMTENEESLLIYAGNFQSNFAFFETT